MKRQFHIGIINVQLNVTNCERYSGILKEQAI